MDLKMLKMLGTGAKVMTMLPINLLMAGSDSNVTAMKDRSAWEEEKNDILERANWLCSKVITEPDRLIAEAPDMIGSEFQGEWAIYSCSMLAHALANISVLYPETKDKCPGLIARLIDIVNTPEIRNYDTMMWGEDAMKTLDGDSSHMTYLSILAWMITNYKMTGGDGRYDTILNRCCEASNRRMWKSRYNLNLLSFPRMEIFIPDMLVTIIALHNYSLLYNGEYADSVDAWLRNARTAWIHSKTGLLAGMLPRQRYGMKGMKMRGSYSALNCSYLSLVDEDFARGQYELLKQCFTANVSFMGRKVCGIREYLNKMPDFTLKGGDAGLVVKGVSAGGTAFALGAATFFGDWEFRYQLLRTAEIGGGTVKEKNSRHYRLGEFALVGEATALAMRTNIKR